jgi:hypothetical protein
VNEWRWMGRGRIDEDTVGLTHAFRTYASGDPVVALCGAMPDPRDLDQSRRQGRICPICSIRRKDAKPR